VVPPHIPWENIPTIVLTNEKDVEIEIDEESRKCTMYGVNPMEVDSTYHWFMEMLQQCYSDTNTSSDRQPRAEAIDNTNRNGQKQAEARQQIPLQRNSDAVSNRNDTGGKIHSDPSKSSTSCRGDFVRDLKVEQGSLRMSLKNNVVVNVCQGDMLHQQTEVIVNSANDQLAHGGGLARAILTAGGRVIEDESREIIRKQGPVKPGQVVHTTAGNIARPVRFVIHAVPPSQYQMTSGKEGEEKLVEAFYNTMKYANDTLNVSSISIPPFGAGIFNVPIDIIMRAAYKALGMFNQHSASPCLREVNIISIDPNLVKQMTDAFKHLYDGTGTNPESQSTYVGTCV
jgi:putative ATPase